MGDIQGTGEVGDTGCSGRCRRHTSLHGDEDRVRTDAKKGSIIMGKCGNVYYKQNDAYGMYGDSNVLHGI